MLAYETIILLDIEKNSESFIDHFSFLRSIYDVFPQFRKPFYYGLNLLYLLSKSRLDQFYVNLEYLPEEYFSDPLIAFPCQLEDALMDGIYNRVSFFFKNCPNSYYAYLLQPLLDTVK